MHYSSKKLAIIVEKLDRRYLNWLSKQLLTGRLFVMKKIAFAYCADRDNTLVTQIGKRWLECK